MEIEQQIYKFVVISNWVIFAVFFILSMFIFQPDVIRGVVLGGLIATLNFHLLDRSLKKSLIPHHTKAHYILLIKYYGRFLASACIIFFIISKKFAHPLGLLAGLSIVVLSIFLATLYQTKKTYIEGE